MQRDEWAIELYAAVARQALKDHAVGYHKPGIFSAGKWLRLAGLLTDDGIDTRGMCRSSQKLSDEVAIPSSGSAGQESEHAGDLPMLATRP
jgi:hypothetical protein